MAAAGDSLPADPADQPPFGGGETFQLSKPPSETEPPPGFVLSADRVAAIATDAVSGELDDEGSATGEVRVRTRLGTEGEPQWQVDIFDADGTDVAQVVIDDAKRRGGREVDGLAGRDEARPRLRGRGLGRPERLVVLAAALRRVPGAVRRPAPAAPAPPPRPARAPRLQRLAFLLQQGRDRPLGAAGLSGPRLRLHPDADRGVQAFREPRPAAAGALPQLVGCGNRRPGRGARGLRGRRRAR